MKPPYAIGSVPSLSGHAIAYRWRSLPRVRRHRCKGRRGRRGKEKEWTDCVQSDIRAFGIARDWKATALKAEVWVETIPGGRREVHDRVEERRGTVDATRHRQEEREAMRLGKLRITLRSDTHWPILIGGER